MAAGNIFHALWYSALPLQAFGANPIYLLKKNGSAYFKVSFISVLYILILIAFIACSSWYSHHIRNNIYLPDDIVLVATHTEIRALLGPICTILMLISSICSAPTACQVVSGLSEFTAYLPHYFSAMHYRYALLGSIFMVSCFFITSIHATLFEISAVNNITHDSLNFVQFITFLISWMSFDVITWAALSQMLIHTSMVFLQFRALDQELQSGLKKLSYWKPANQVVNVIPKQSMTVPDDLRRYRRLYINLTCVAEDINKTFETRLLILISFNTVLLCFSLFIVLLNIADVPNILPLCITIPWLFCRIASIFYAIYPFCCITYKIAGITTTVHNWIAKFDNDSITEEITGATLSYLVTLVQFHMLFKAKPNGNILGAVPNMSSTDHISSENYH